MSHTFSLVDSLSLNDLQVFLGRAATVEGGSVRLIAGSGVLAVYVAVLYPAGLLDDSPTVLGLRTFALTTKHDFDVVVPLGSLQERLTRLQAVAEGSIDPIVVTLPIEVNTMTWSAISPPKGGWRMLGEADHARFVSVAKAGIEEVALAIPTGTGEQIVRQVRTEVWGRPITGLEHIPAGGAFAAYTLGFLGVDDKRVDETGPHDTGADDPVRVYETGPWTRLTTKRGHVLIKRRAWSLLR